MQVSATFGKAHPVDFKAIEPVSRTFDGNTLTDEPDRVGTNIERKHAAVVDPQDQPAG